MSKFPLLFLMVFAGCVIANGIALLAIQRFGFFQLFTLGVVLLLLLLLAGKGHLVQEKNALPVWISVPYCFVMVNLYSLKGILRAMRGETQATWISVLSKGG